MAKKLLPIPSAGEMLKTEFLDEMGMSQNALARALGVPNNRIHEIVKDERSISADTDLRLCKFFGLSEGYFLSIQMTCDIMKAKRTASAAIAKITPYRAEEQTSSRPRMHKKSS